MTLRWWQFKKSSHCPHVDVYGIYGDEINASQGYRNYCADCGKLLDGPVSISVSRQDSKHAA